VARPQHLINIPRYKITKTTSLLCVRWNLAHAKCAGLLTAASTRKKKKTLKICHDPLACKSLSIQYEAAVWKVSAVGDKSIRTRQRYESPWDLRGVEKLVAHHHRTISKHCKAATPGPGRLVYHFRGRSRTTPAAYGSRDLTESQPNFRHHNTWKLPQR